MFLAALVLPDEKERMTAEKQARRSQGGAKKPVQARPMEGKRVTVRLGDELDKKLQAIADDRHMPAAAVVRTALEMYLQREEFAVGLSDMETNIASTLNAARKDTAKVAEDVQMVIAILDQFLRFSMIAAPEIIDKQGAVALGNKRYNGFIADLHKAFHTRRKKAVLTQTIEGMESEG